MHLLYRLAITLCQENFIATSWLRDTRKSYRALTYYLPLTKAGELLYSSLHATNCLQSMLLTFCQQFVIQRKHFDFGCMLMIPCHFNLFIKWHFEPVDFNQFVLRDQLIHRRLKRYEFIGVWRFGLFHKLVKFKGLTLTIIFFKQWLLNFRNWLLLMELNHDNTVNSRM